MSELIGLLLGAAFGFVVGLAAMQDTMKDDAIEAGVAHYVCDDQSGDCEFQYKVAE